MLFTVFTSWLRRNRKILRQRECKGKSCIIQIPETPKLIRSEMTSNRISKDKWNTPSILSLSAPRQRMVSTARSREKYFYICTSYILNIYWYNSVKHPVIDTQRTRLPCRMICLHQEPLCGICAVVFRKYFYDVESKSTDRTSFQCSAFEFLSRWRSWLIKNVHIVVGFVPASMWTVGSALLGMILLRLKDSLPTPLITWNSSFCYQ